MAHIYMTFDFGSDEEKAQQARHKLDTWKQTFRLDKKMLYKFDRAEVEATEGEPAAVEKSAKAAGSKDAKGKGKANPEPAKLASSNGSVKLLLRLALSNHEKITEQRLVARIPSEEPFQSASPKTLREKDAGFGEVATRFEDLERHGPGFQRPA